MEKTVKTLSPVEKEIRREKVVRVIQKILSYLFLVLMALVILVPFYWMINTALKDSREILLDPPTLFPKERHWENFINSIKNYNFGRYFLNTIIVGVITTGLSLVTTITAAFAFARLNFKGRDLVFALLLSTMMIPGEMFVLSNYITVAHFKWLNTYQALIVPFIVSVYYTYLLRNTFKQIPNELYLAAKVDGTSDLKYLFKVMIPLASPTIITMCILRLMGSWNSYVWPALVASDESMKLITNGLRTAFTNSDTVDNSNMQMAATTMVSIPLFVVFLLFRKYIMRGVSRSGIKG